MTICKAFICGSASLSIGVEERAFLADQKPVGFILFQRNCKTKDQVRRLVADFREAVGVEDLLVLIDQEGGRVARLAPPVWDAFPSGQVLGRLIESERETGVESVTLLMQLLATQLYEVGINVNCAPVLDIPVSGADDIIGDRAYGKDADLVSVTGRAVMNGLSAGGVLPVIKHIPGHGRAGCDSHVDLPVIETDAETLQRNDFVPFEKLRDAPLGMTAHVVLAAYDAQCAVSVSADVVADVIRSKIGFDGALMCDDLSMKALSGTMRERTQKVFAAGCDLALHCNGDMSEMLAVADVAPALDGDGARRVSNAFSALEKPEDFDKERAEHLRSRLMSA